MGHHINDKGEFQSDKYPDIGPNKIVFSFRDPDARPLLFDYAKSIADRELGDDMLTGLKNVKDTETLKPCPFCENTGAEYDLEIIEFGEGLDKKYAGKCSCCGAIQSLVVYRTDAVENWNRRRDINTTEEIQ